MKGHTDRVALIHWSQEEAEELAAIISTGGWDVTIGVPDIKRLKASPPAAIAISLERLPSHGREIADAVWYTKWGREIPIIFFDGKPDKVEATRRRFPAAELTTWEKLPRVLRKLVV